ncbi:MAG: hypothetical protein EPO06_06205 [Burkholderiaceae bacterium]|nr:MAG: hypothetical protein EPO06_06205 [Burkholderiaceae bacterium]
MTRHEKLILLVIALLLAGRLSGLAREIYLARTYGAVIPDQVLLFWRNVSDIFDILTNLGAAVWLYVEARLVALKSWVWALLGIFFGLIGVILFYAIQKPGSASVARKE